MTRSLVRTLCPKCRAVGFDADTCGSCGIHFESYRRHLEKLKTQGPAPWRTVEDAYDPTLRADRAFHDWKLVVFPLPVAALGSLVFKFLGPLDHIPTYLITIPTHELGHALMAWLNGHFALPLGVLIPMAAVTQVSQSRSVAVSLIAMIALGWVAYRSFRESRWFPALTSSVLILATLICSWSIPDRDSMLLITWAGCGGEFILGTLFVSAFFHRAPLRWRWDFFRFPVMGAGTYALVSAWLQWHRIASGARSLPIGSFLDTGSSGGDMGALLNTYGWAQARIIGSYVTLGRVCLAVVVLQYVYFAGRAILSFRSGSTSAS